MQRELTIGSAANDENDRNMCFEVQRYGSTEIVLSLLVFVRQTTPSLAVKTKSDFVPMTKFSQAARGGDLSEGA